MEITLTAADQFLGVVFTVGVIQMIKKPFMKDPAVINGVKVAFVITAVIQLAIAYYIKRKVSKANNQKKFKYKPEASLLSASEGQDQEVEITYSEYDSNEATKMLRSIAFNSILYTALSFKLKNTQPMILQMLNLLKSLFLSPLYRAHLYGMDVKRPFERNILISFNKAAAEEEVAPTQAEKKKKKEE